MPYTPAERDTIRTVPAVILFMMVRRGQARLWNVDVSVTVYLKLFLQTIDRFIILSKS